MARYFERDRMPREGNPYGNRFTRRSGWAPTRGDFDWTDNDSDDDHYYRAEDDNDDGDRHYMVDPGSRNRGRPGRQDWAMQGRREATRDFWQRDDDEVDRRYTWERNPYWAEDRNRRVTERRFTGEGRYRDYERPRTTESRSQRYGDVRQYADNDRVGRTGWEPDRDRYRNYGDDDRFMGNRDYQTRFEDVGMTEGWRNGPHVGRGPRGYRRSDDSIRDDVCERLWDDGMVDASDIDVSVADGEVLLEGYVDNRYEKRQAEITAEMARGVTDVRNHLRIRSQQRMDRGDDRAYAGTQYADMNRRTTAGAATADTGMNATVGRSSIHVEMGVIAADGDNLGQVKEVRATDFLLDRSMKRDIYIPFNLVRSATNDNLFLTVSEDELDKMDLNSSSLMGDVDAGVRTTTDVRE
jgi:hypothetical protein